MQNHGYLEMISPSWPQNRPSCQGVSQKIWHRLQGNPFLDIVIVPSLKVDIEVTPLTSINPLGIPTLLNLSQITKGLIQKTAFSSPSPEGTSARLPECIVSWRTLTSDPQVLSIVSGYNISFLQTPFQKSPLFIQTLGQEALLISQEGNELLQKGVIHKTPFTRDSFFLTAACFLYSKRKDLCVH